MPFDDFQYGNTFVFGEQPVASKWDQLWRNDDDIYDAMHHVDSYTPSTTGITLGSGTLVGSYSEVGVWVDFFVSFLLGSGSAITGSVSFTVPVTMEATVGSGQRSIGETNMQDTGTGNFIGNVPKLSDTTVAARRYDVSGDSIESGNLNSTIPFTWASGDVLNVRGRYRKALS